MKLTEAMENRTVSKVNEIIKKFTLDFESFKDYI